MKKYFICFLLFFICLCSDCYALDSNIIIESIKEKDKLVVDFSIGENISYGFSTKLDYDKNTMELVSCDGKNGYEVSYNTNYIVVENVAGSSNKTVATCTFSLAEDKTTEVIIEDITSSDYKSAVDEGDFKLNLREGVEEVVLENIPDTAANMVIVYVFFGFIFIIVGGFLIYTFIFNKKMASVICLAFAFIVPFVVDAKISNMVYTQDELKTIRSTLLHEKQSDNNYDVDSDGEVTINDLIVVKVDLDSLDVDLTPQSSNKNPGAKSNVYVALTQKVNVTSKTRLKEAKYCVTSGSGCTPNMNFFNVLSLNKATTTVTIPNSVMSSGSTLCVKAVNMAGKTRQFCKRYVIDNKSPTINYKSYQVSSNYPIVSNGAYNYISNVSYSFGVSGGKTTCKLRSCSTSQSTTSSQYKNCQVECTAAGNNGYSRVISYYLVEVDPIKPNISVINSQINRYNTTLESNYNFKGNVRYGFGVKGGNVTCTDNITTGGSSASIYRTHSVTCTARGNNALESYANYKIIEYDNKAPEIKFKSSVVNVDVNQSYDYKTNISSSEFGLKGGIVNCTNSSFVNNTSKSSTILSSSTVSCQAKGNNGQSTTATYTFNRSDYKTPTISVKQGNVIFDNVTSDNYDLKTNIISSFGPKGGEVVCTKGSKNLDTSISPVRSYYNVSCQGKGNNGRNSSFITYRIEERDTVTPTISLRSSFVTTTSAYYQFDYKSVVSGYHFGAKGGNVSCSVSGSIVYGGSGTEYLRVPITCKASGNNGKSTSVTYALVERDEVYPQITFKKSVVPYSLEVIKNYTSNIASVSYGKKGGSVSCTRDETVTTSHKVKCVATGNNGYSSTDYYIIR